MGNCSQKSCTSGSSVRGSRVRVWTEAGELMEFEGSRMAREVLVNFPGRYGIFRGGETRWPMEEEERLQSGHVYYALPLGKGNSNGRRRRRALTPPTATPPSSSGSVVGRDGVWRVKLAISVEELEEVLAGQLNLDGFIHKIRMGQGLNVGN